MSALVLLLGLSLALPGADREQAWRDVEDGRLDAAARGFRAVVAEDPDDVEAAVALADLLDHGGDPAGALALLDGAGGRPGGGRALVHAAWLRIRRGDLDGATATLDRAEERAGGRPEAIREVGRARHEVAREADRRRRVRDLDARQDRALLLVAGAWLVLILAGLRVARRRHSP